MPLRCTFASSVACHKIWRHYKHAVLKLSEPIRDSRNAMLATVLDTNESSTMRHMAYMFTQFITNEVNSYRGFRATYAVTTEGRSFVRWFVECTNVNEHQSWPSSFLVHLYISQGQLPQLVLSKASHVALPRHDSDKSANEFICKPSPPHPLRMWASVCCPSSIPCGWFVPIFKSLEI
jgi:hypothetical protein